MCVGGGTIRRFGVGSALVSSEPPPTSSQDRDSLSGPSVPWPPAGAKTRRVTIVERIESDGTRVYERTHGDPLESVHAHGLIWLLDEHDRAPTPTEAGRAQIELQIATTSMRGGRVGHTYALNGGVLGAPGADHVRGVLWRFLERAVADLSQ